MKKIKDCDECKYLIDIRETREGNIVIVCEKEHTEFDDNCSDFREDD